MKNIRERERERTEETKADRDRDKQTDRPTDRGEGRYVLCSLVVVTCHCSFRGITEHHIRQSLQKKERQEREGILSLN